MKHHHHHRGFTLIELVVVIALIAALVVVLVPMAANALRVDQRKASIELAATLRYVRDEAVVRNAPMRIAYDLSSHAWWVEAADGPVRIFRNRSDREAFENWMELKKEGDQRVQEMVDNNRTSIPTMSDVLANLMGTEDDENSASAAGMMGGFLGGLFGGGNDLGAERGREYKVNEFRPLEEEEFAKREFPPGVRFYGVWTPQYDDVLRPPDEFDRARAEDGDEGAKRVVYTHVFPGGYMEDTVVYLSDPEEQGIMSVTVEPLTGRVALVRDYVEPPDLRDRGY